MVRIILSILFVLTPLCSALAIDNEYLNMIRKEIDQTNKHNLPKQVDRITTMENIVLLEKDGKYYVVSKMVVDTDLKKIGVQALKRVRQNSIQSGCSDPAVVDYLNHGLLMGGVFFSDSGHQLGEIEYSKSDCP